MSLQSFDDPSELYLARGDEVSDRRPVFTGDVFENVTIPGIQENGMAVVVAHPCSMRGKHGSFRDRVLVAHVVESKKIGKDVWENGYFDLTPFPDLYEGKFHVGHFDSMGSVCWQALTTGRLACLSPFGLNLLEQRLIWHVARIEVPISKIEQAFAHLFEETELLHEWNDTLCESGISVEDATKYFEEFIRSNHDDGFTLQDMLKIPERRPEVRRACRSTAKTYTV